MRRKLWIIKDILINVFVLLFLGFVLFWVTAKVNSLAELKGQVWLSYALALAFILYLYLVLVTLRKIFTNYFLKRYDPGSRTAIEELRSNKKYFLNPQEARQIELVERPLYNIYEGFLNQGYEEIAREDFGIVLSRKLKLGKFSLLGKEERIILFYSAKLNIFTVNKLIEEVSEYILAGQKKKYYFNHLIICTNRENELETLSAACGVLNFLGKLAPKLYLGLALLDLKYAKLYYPVDRSLQNSLQRTWQDQVRKNIVSHLFANLRAKQVRLENKKP